MQLYGVTFTGPFADSMEAAFKRRDDRIALIGQQAYDAETAEARRVQIETEQRALMLACAKKMIGARHADCTFENFRVNSRNRAAYERCKALSEHIRPAQWREKDTRDTSDTRKSPDIKGVMLCGGNGIGKNHLAAAVTVALAARNIPVFYGSVTRIKQRLCDAMSSGMEEAAERITESPLIVINDLGAERETDFARELLFHLIDRIYERRRVLMITTNIQSDVELGRRYGKRVVSRLMAMCDVLVYEDADHRLMA